MLNGNNIETEVLRAIKTKFIEWETAKNAKPLDEQAIIRKMISDRTNSAEIYNNAGRKDLSSRELIEIEYLLEYKEEGVSEDLIITAINTELKNGAKTFGDVMKGVKLRLPNADLKLVSKILKNIL